VTGTSFVKLLSGHLDRGEAEAIALAIEMKVDLEMEILQLAGEA